MRFDREHKRVWILGRRLHHGICGLALMGFGAVLTAHDWADRREWFGR